MTYLPRDTRACTCGADRYNRAEKNPAERYQMFQDYLVRRAAEVTQNNLSGVTDFAGWKRKRPEVLKRFLYVLGLDPMPPRTPLNARIKLEVELQRHFKHSTALLFYRCTEALLRARIQNPVGKVQCEPRVSGLKERDRMVDEVVRRGPKLKFPVLVVGVQGEVLKQ